MLDDPKPWREIYPTFEENPFEQLSLIFAVIGITNAQATVAYNDFNRDYYDSLSWYDNLSEVKAVLAAFNLDLSKYKNAYLIYNATKSETRIREPDLTTSTHGSANGSATMERKQTSTQTETPNNYGSTKTHMVSPFDNPSFLNESQDTITQNGTRTVTTTYTGQPDKSTSTSSANSSTTETGTDTITATTLGSDGKTVEDQMAAFDAASTAWAMLKKDIAKKLFLQLWR